MRVHHPPLGALLVAVLGAGARCATHRGAAHRAAAWVPAVTRRRRVRGGCYLRVQLVPGVTVVLRAWVPPVLMVVGAALLLLSRWL